MESGSKSQEQADWIEPLSLETISSSRCSTDTEFRSRPRESGIVFVMIKMSCPQC